MGGQAKEKVSKHQSSSQKSTGAGSSSDDNTSSSAPRSTKSTYDISRYDGPNSPPPSQPKSPGSPSRSSIKSPPQEQKSPSSTALGPRITIKPKNFDLGLAQWSLIQGQDVPRELPKRPKTFTKLGQETKVGLNTFNVTTYPTVDVYQYEVMIGNGVEKRGVVTKVWNSKAIKTALGNQVIFDGDRLAWGFKPIKREIREIVDLDLEEKRTPKPGKNNQFRVCIRETTIVRFDILQQFLLGKTSWSDRCLEAINCLDHILREHPSQRLQAIKRAFYPRTGTGTELGGGLEAIKGVYQSLRVALGPQGPCLTINVDVANGTFFKALPLVHIFLQMTGARDVNDLERTFKQTGADGRYAKEIKRLQKKRVVTKHRKGHEDEYVIDRFDYRGAKNIKFSRRDAAGNEVQVSVYDYFRQEYGITLRNPDLPVIRTPKGSLVPSELTQLRANQVCRHKLNEQQTSNMIKFAVTPSAERWNAVQQGLATLNWQADPVIKTFGLKMSTTRTVVPGRVLPAPKVVFGGGGSANPGTSGRWDLKGKKFLTSNSAPLKVWGVMVISGNRGGKPSKDVVEAFIKAFVNAYVAHGGRVELKQPPMLLSAGTDPAAWVTTAWNTIGTQFQTRPQLIMFILPDKNSVIYQKIKRSMDCRFGAVSQCIQYAHAQKAAPQYISNVLMKVNSKLGGLTCRAVGPKSAGNTGLFTAPTVIIGADVSHAAPGSQASSTAALTVSMDQLGIQYAAAVDSNGYRTEMIHEANIKKHLTPLMERWMTNVNNGKLPSRVIYIRDGVSEGQFQAVLEQEVPHMRAVLQGGGANVKFVVIIAGKRHHIRFFPERGDRNGNPFPGTLIESGATHPYENDFYLCAHAAIKGTARPVHYQVIMNETEMTNDDIYTLLYEHSYQYLRATTPVSIHPAVYYAHIAAARGVCHDPAWGTDTDSSSHPSQSQQGSAVAPPLLPMPNDGGIRFVPWYI